MRVGTMFSHGLLFVAAGLMCLAAPAAAQDEGSDDDRTMWEYKGERWEQIPGGKLEYRGESWEKDLPEGDLRYERERFETELGVNSNPPDTHFEGLGIEPFTRQTYEFTPYIAFLIVDDATGLDDDITGGFELTANFSDEWGLRFDFGFASSDFETFIASDRKVRGEGDVWHGDLAAVWRPEALAVDYWAPWVSLGGGVTGFTHFKYEKDRFDPHLSLGVGVDYKWTDTWWMEFGVKSYFVYTRMGKGYNSISGLIEPYFGMTVAF